MKRVLFIGNSFTYCHDLPAMLERLAREAGFDIECRMVAKGGWYLSWYADPEGEMREPMLEAYKDGPWDYIVLQDQSLNPAENPADFAAAADALCGEMRCGQFVFYQTWAYEDGSEKLASTGRSYDELYRQLKEAYSSAAQRNGALCAPVGDGFALCHRLYPQVYLYGLDNYHPGVPGTYLAACIFYAVLSGRSPAELSTPEGVDEKEAALLRDVACRTIS